MAAEKDDPIVKSGEGSDKKKQENGKKMRKKGDEDKVELSEEDLELKANLEMMVERIRDGNPAIQSTALDNISRHDHAPRTLKRVS